MVGAVLVPRVAAVPKGRSSTVKSLPFGTVATQNWLLDPIKKAPGEYPGPRLRCENDKPNQRLAKSVVNCVIAVWIVVAVVVYAVVVVATPASPVVISLAASGSSTATSE